MPDKMTYKQNNIWTFDKVHQGKLTHSYDKLVIRITNSHYSNEQSDHYKSYIRSFTDSRNERFRTPDWP